MCDIGPSPATVAIGEVLPVCSASRRPNVDNVKSIFNVHRDDLKVFAIWEDGNFLGELFA